jgi:hypothetical protein
MARKGIVLVTDQRDPHSHPEKAKRPSSGLHLNCACSASREKGGSLQDGELRTILGKPGTTVSVDADAPHTFRNAGDAQGRLLFVHIPAALAEFFEEYGVPVSRELELPEGLEPPDFGEMAAALERNRVKVLGLAEAVR